MEALNTSTKSHTKSSKSKENNFKHKETSNNSNNTENKAKSDENKTNNSPAPVVNSSELNKPDLAQINNNYNKLLENNRVIIIIVSRDILNFTKINLSIGYKMIMIYYYCFFFNLKNIFTNKIPDFFLLESEKQKLNLKNFWSLSKQTSPFNEIKRKICVKK
jgi:hypothetical protein